MVIGEAGTSITVDCDRLTKAFFATVESPTEKNHAYVEGALATHAPGTNRTNKTIERQTRPIMDFTYDDGP